MKTKTAAVLREVWQLFTEVPGWPDAPPRRRLRRALPLLLPALATLILVGWEAGYHTPGLRALLAAHQPLLELEQEVAALHLEFSEQQVAELAQQEELLLQQLPRDLREAREFLLELEREAKRLGWSATLRLQDPPAEAELEGELFIPITARARLAPEEHNQAPLPSLLKLLERVRTSSRRFELMRLTIGADEGKWHTVELGLRLPVPVPHAQAAQ